MEIVMVDPNGKVEQINAVDLTPTAPDMNNIPLADQAVRILHKAIPKEAAEEWIEQNGYQTPRAVNSGGCENFAMFFLDLFPGGDMYTTEDFVDWDHGAYPGGHAWIISEGRHFDSEALEGVDSWRELPFFKRAMAQLKTVTWLSKLWMGRIDKPSVIISIGDPKESLPDLACDPIDLLRIEVDDVNEDLGPEYRMFDWHDARKILEFEHRYKDHDIIVHCAAGVSRSSAVALFLADHTNRILDISKPCSGDYSLHNKWVYRQMQITRIDLLGSGAQITRKGSEL